MFCLWLKKKSQVQLYTFRRHMKGRKANELLFSANVRSWPQQEHASTPPWRQTWAAHVSLFQKSPKQTSIDKMDLHNVCYLLASVHIVLYQADTCNVLKWNCHQENWALCNGSGPNCSPQSSTHSHSPSHRHTTKTADTRDIKDLNRRWCSLASKATTEWQLSTIK